MSSINNSSNSAASTSLMSSSVSSSLASSVSSPLSAVAGTTTTATTAGDSSSLIRKYKKGTSNTTHNPSSSSKADTVAEPTPDAIQRASELKKRIEQQYEQLSNQLMERDRSSLSSGAVDKATAAKFYLEQQMENSRLFMEARAQRRQRLEEMLAESNLADEEKNNIRAEMRKKESMITRGKRIRVDKNDFNTVKVIGRGGFAEVRLVRKRDSGNVYAMKVLKKAEVLEWNQVSHIRAERDVMAEAAGANPWVTSLFYAFQDPDYLYIIMEYVPGGDMMTKLVAHDTFSLEITRFYLAEILLAVISVHNMSYIHRDIKPDNILIDREGHVKLTDFGLCTGFHDDRSIEEVKRKIQANKEVASAEDMSKDAAVSSLNRLFNYKKMARELAYSTVGSPNYIAPEVLLKSGYGKECDFWSVGIIMFEMLCGYPSFCSTSDNVTYWKIVRWRDYFAFPDGVHIDAHAKDLISRLVCDSNDRLGANGLADFKEHPFFKGFDWDKIRSKPGPFKPDLLSDTDTSHFDTVNEDEWDIYENQFANATDKTKDLPFVGFTFKRHDSPDMAPKIPEAFIKSQGGSASGSRPL